MLKKTYQDSLSITKGNKMKQTNDLILKLASLQAAILINVNAYDDDLESTWQALKDDYDAIKIAMDNYIKKGES